MDLETRIAGRWLNRIGIVALLFAVTYFLKYAFDNNWIGPTGRVGIGILLGSAMIPWSQWLLGRGYTYFSEGITGLGEAVLYTSVWAGWGYYNLYSQTTAFAAMIVVTAAIAAVALGRNSQRIAILSLLGGFLTPILVSTGKDQEVVLFTYVLILGGGMLVIAWRRDWRWLAPIGYLLTQAYFWAWYQTFYASLALIRTIFFAALFFALYLTLPAMRVVRFGKIDGFDVGIVLMNGGLFLLALRIMLWSEHRWALTIAALLLSAVHLALARLLPKTAEKETPVARILLAGLALTFATLAIPIRLEGKWITLAWAVEGAVLIWSGFRVATPLLRHAGYLLLSAAALRLVFLPIPAKQFIVNARFAAFAVLVACFAAALLAARRSWDNLTDNEKLAYGVFAVAVHAYAIAALSLELWDYFGRSALSMDRALAQQLALSILWVAYATGLILFGVKRDSALLRWQALALFGIVVLKVFFFDLSFLERFYRILSFLFLGLVLLVVSFLYQRKLQRRPSRP
ncbi:MAG TPA: DUF2339 domain-containing protein [Methylomirabilota bacterium]|nr:DUF2339 domain-containing protein [Methylomirabilota bacterium]